MSWLKWLDYSSAERDAVLTLLASRKDKGTIDEFGIGTIRDGIADHLFPCLSTIQTRAKYFLFVPWILRAMEARTSETDWAKGLAHSERRLIEALKRDDGADKHGLIGSESGDGLKRFPSAIYWSGIRQLRIFQDDSSLAEYLDEIGDLRRAARADTGLEASDEPPPVEARSWDPGLPPAEPGYLNRTSLALSRDQAIYLQEKVQGLRTVTGRPCLLQWLMSESVPDAALAPLDRPWALIEPMGTSLPEHLHRELNHAKLFSLLVEGLTTLYYFFLARDLASTGRMQMDHHRRALETWCAQVAAEARSLHAWRSGLAEFWLWVNQKAPRTGQVRGFVEHWLEGLADQGFEPRVDGLTTAANRAFLRQREQRQKGSLARLMPGGPLERWKVEVSATSLNYRWRTGRQFVTDVAAGLARG